MLSRLHALRSVLRVAGARCASLPARRGMCSAPPTPPPPLPPPSPPAQLGWWLLGCSGAVFGMVVLGGVTRLTRSGLSMTDWRPQGSLPPTTDQEWQREFDKYKHFPEYQRLHPDMTLDEFKGIFWLEWGHRMAGRMVGVIFGVPLAYFAMRGRIPAALAPRLGLLFCMGGGQGLVGWWMVKSGLEEPTHEDGIPRVSPYRLAAHLTTAFAIYTLLLYTALGILQPRSPGGVVASLAPYASRIHALAGLIGITAVSGAFVAGMQAGLAFNTFPLMEGRLIPEGYFELQPAYRNLFESVPSVQLHHRVLALTTLGSVSGFWLWAVRMPLPPQLKLATNLLLVGAWAQVGLGITTLLYAVPVHLGSAHQAGALTLFSIAVFCLHSVRVPNTAVAGLRAARALTGKSMTTASGSRGGTAAFAAGG